MVLYFIIERHVNAAMGIFVDATGIKDEPEKMNVSNACVLLDLTLVVYKDNVIIVKGIESRKLHIRVFVQTFICYFLR